MTLADRLNVIMVEKVVGTTELARRMKTDRSVVKQLRSGRRRQPKLGTLFNIAKGLELTVAELLAGVDVL